MIKVEVPSTEVFERSGVSSKTGKSYHIREQRAYAHLPSGKYPQEIIISLRDDQAPYAPGLYQLDPMGFYVSRFKSLDYKLKLIKPAV